MRGWITVNRIVKARNGDKGYAATINIAQIRYYEDHNHGGSVISFSNEDYIRVKETPAELAALMRE